MKIAGQEGKMYEIRECRDNCSGEVFYRVFENLHGKDKQIAVFLYLSDAELFVGAKEIEE